MGLRVGSYKGVIQSCIYGSGVVVTTSPHVQFILPLSTFAIRATNPSDIFYLYS